MKKLHHSQNHFSLLNNRFVFVEKEPSGAPAEDEFSKAFDEELAKSQPKSEVGDMIEDKTLKAQVEIAARKGTISRFLNKDKNESTGPDLSKMTPHKLSEYYAKQVEPIRAKEKDEKEFQELINKPTSELVSGEMKKEAIEDLIAMTAKEGQIPEPEKGFRINEEARAENERKRLSKTVARKSPEEMDGEYLAQTQGEVDAKGYMKEGAGEMARKVVNEGEAPTWQTRRAQMLKQLEGRTDEEKEVLLAEIRSIEEKRDQESAQREVKYKKDYPLQTPEQEEKEMFAAFKKAEAEREALAKAVKAEEATKLAKAEKTKKRAPLPKGTQASAQE